MLLTCILVGSALSERYRVATGQPIIYADLPHARQRTWQRVARRAAIIAFDSRGFTQLKRWKLGHDLHEIAPQLAQEAGETHSPVWDAVARAAAETFLYCRDKQLILPMIGRRLDMKPDEVESEPALDDDCDQESA